MRKLISEQDARLLIRLYGIIPALDMFSRENIDIMEDLYATH